MTQGQLYQSRFYHVGRYAWTVIVEPPRYWALEWSRGNWTLWAQCGPVVLLVEW